MMRIIISVFLFLILTYTLKNLSAQELPVKKDSSSVYRKIEAFSQKRKFTKFLYRLVLRPVATTSAITNKSNNNHLRTIYRNYEGKIIRNISIVTIDPFGHNLSDTTVYSQNFLRKMGNKLHAKTQNATIRNILIIKKNKPFDSLLVKESERLIRSQSYIHDVLFTFGTSEEKSDTVDIYIRVLDEWSIVPKGAFSGTHFGIELNDKNLAGLGHNFDENYNLNHTNGKQSIYTNYQIPNFRNTYIGTTLNYQTNEDNHYKTSIDLERPFYSPLAKWAGGLLVSQQIISNNLISNNESTRILFNSRLNTLDVWGAESWQIFKGNTVDRRTTRLILSARYMTNHYLDKPPMHFDTLFTYSDESLYLVGIGISTRQYVKDRYVFNFGVPEDVPVGRTYGIVGGYRLKNSVNWYWGIRYALGNYYPWGFFSTNLEYGTFITNSKTEQGVFNAEINYFTGLFSIGKWKLRQIVKPVLTVGLKRLSTDSLTLHETQGFNRFNSTGLIGTQRLLLKLQTQSYAPWKVFGFRFGPYLMFSLGILGNSNNGFRHSRVYSELGIGALIKNDYWVINSFQISFAYYPSIPGNGDNIFKTDSFKTTDFGFIDFDLGKPGTIVYQ